MIGALKELKVPLLRWPGSCFADERHWRDGIGTRHRRPVKLNTHWGGVPEDNAAGHHEFFDLAEQLGATEMPGLSASAARGKDGKLDLALVNANATQAAELALQLGTAVPTAVRSQALTAVADARTGIDAAPDFIGPRGLRFLSSAPQRLPRRRCDTRPITGDRP